ncbi:hypothetical protein PS639_04182 [Pseudomonas fluorescens]|nr:hypothetical protein PS639_04182 [Pseudomonas fluorescens]
MFWCFVLNVGGDYFLLCVTSRCIFFVFTQIGRI